MLNQLSSFILKEYGPKAAATALQLVVPAPRNDQENRKVTSTAAIVHIKTTAYKMQNIPYICIVHIKSLEGFAGGLSARVVTFAVVSILQLSLQ